MKRIFTLSTILVLFLNQLSYSQKLTTDIRLNQIGFFPNAQKIAIVVSTTATDFEIKTEDLSISVFKGILGKEASWTDSGEKFKIADFTSFALPGKYVLVISDKGKSNPFSIADNALVDLAKGSIKAFYYQRCSTPLLKEFAGIWARNAGHPDNQVVVLPSAASTSRPAGTKISTPYGWYDAGDYNKYIVNSGVSTFSLLSAYEFYPDMYDTLNLNIPESKNMIPDILDEALWNLHWVFTMQDPEDGGVYNKTTNANFDGMVMPDKATSTRYVCAKGTAATLDFAALMAMSSRIYKKHMPEFADSCLQKALTAWEWAKANPKVAFNNPGASGSYPAVSTGGYGDSNFSDEFSWAAAELYISTKDEKFYPEIKLTGGGYNLPGWPNVKSCGLLSLVANRKNLSSIADTTTAKNELFKLAKSASDYQKSSSPYKIPNNAFYWGGNSQPATQAMILCVAFELTANLDYFNAAVSAIDYLTGRNATTYCFVTGFGSKHPMHIHHRQSDADKIDEPVPGLVAGGANPQNTTDCNAGSYPSSLPAKCYLDNVCSYSTNEIAINWNAPLVFGVGAVQYAYQKHFLKEAPKFLYASLKTVNLSFTSDAAGQIFINSNMDWKIVSDQNWCLVKPLTEANNTTINISVTSDNTGENSRSAMLIISNELQSIDTIYVTQNGMSKNFRIESENYASMSGIQTESTTDDGLGLNIGYVEVDDWIEYNLDIAFPGVYQVDFRNASQTNGGLIDIYVDGMVVNTLTTPVTNGWQNWETTTLQLEFTKGTHKFRLNFKKSGVNLNWMQFQYLKPLGIQQQFTNEAFNVYPVPARQTLFFQSKQLNISNIIVSIYSLDNRLALQKVVYPKSENDIDISSLQTGIYLLKLDTEKGSFTKKILVMR